MDKTPSRNPAAQAQQMVLSPLKHNLIPPHHGNTRLHSQPRHRFSSDSSDDDTTGADLLEKMSRRAQDRAQNMKQPMSSPVRKLTKESPIHSRTLGEKYTLRTRTYVPFHKRDRDNRRDNAQIERRGGSEEMARFVLLQDEKAEKQRLEQEAQAVAPDIDQLSEEDDDPYQRELEEMLRKEEEELDAMLADLTLN